METRTRAAVILTLIAAAVLAVLLGLNPAKAANAGMAANPALATVDGGRLSGVPADKVIAFKGVPYARPPTDGLRWRAPQPVEPWDGVLQASDYKPQCVQPSPEGEPFTDFSEDCLYLNIWRPEGDGPFPVMVWIQGGGLVRGVTPVTGMGAPLYDGANLARQGIIVVSMNYRLGRFGFFAHPALAREASGGPVGNYGYMDQLAALRWIRRNIASFGGNPGRVTLVGESAGGGSVLALLTSPMARGLFHGAVIQSAGIPTPRAGALPMRDLAAAQSIAVDYSLGLGIKGGDKEVLARLRALPAETLNQGTENYVAAMFGDGEIPGLAFSVIDGKQVVDAPESAVRAGRQAKVPVIVGANDYDLAWSGARSKEEVFDLFGSQASRARDLYDPRGDASLDAVIQAVIADRTMIEPSRNLAELLTAAGTPAWWYRYSYVPLSMRGKVSGATHGSELPMVFDAVGAILKDKAGPEDWAMARTVSGYWIDFVKTGNPNGGGRPEWPAYDPFSRRMMEFGNAGANYSADPLEKRLDLWKSIWERGT